MSDKSKKSEPVNRQQCRIIAGQWRGRKLSFPDEIHLRPTTDRVRETLFNWLMNDISGARCLDCFAGSGALGFEALSRGASHVTFVDNNSSIVAALNKNAQQLQASECNILQKNLFHADEWDWATPPYDIIFLDPPFSGDHLSKVLSQLVKQKWWQQSNNKTLVYVESGADMRSKVPPEWMCLKYKVAGQVHYALFVAVNAD